MEKRKVTDLEIGNKAPSFNLPSDNEGQISLDDFKGKKIVLYFYPKDDTPGCTKESCSFNQNLTQLNELNVKVVGVSKCSVKKHNKFKDKYDLKFPLLSDENDDMCERYSVWKEKSMFGKKYMGIERSTFLIDEDGKILKIWRNVKVAGHVEDVTDAITSK